jgi:hypothetical protein
VNQFQRGRLPSQLQGLVASAVTAAGDRVPHGYEFVACEILAATAFSRWAGAASISATAQSAVGETSMAPTAPSR